MGSEVVSENTELVIGLVGAVGTNLARVKKVIKEHLFDAGYKVEEIKISRDVIPELLDIDKWDTPYERFDVLITAGNTARRTAEELDFGLENGNAILAYGASAIISAVREKDEENNPQPAFKTAYIIDSLKRPEEVEALRAIYPLGFILVGAYEAEEQRVKNLCGLNDVDMKRSEAEKLIVRDADEEKEPFGQRVTDTYHLADFFVQVTESPTRLECDIERMVDIWFGHPFRTPTFDEYAMYLAFAASLRSADLSRQVGAVIAREKDNEILSMGANECPRSGGGLYWPVRFDTGCIGDLRDGRDYTRGKDSNRVQQLEIIREIVGIMRKLQESVDEDKLKEALEKSPITDLTEYGRVVHAEMEAMLACARNQLSTKQTTLYCTTFPCHNCAKHIVAAGITRVIYIEPYAKSKAFEFHTDSIVRAEPGQHLNEQEGKVRFEPFVGVGPRRFFDLFSMRHGSSYDLKRKDKQTGSAVERPIEERQLRLQLKAVSYLNLEREASLIFDEIRSSANKDGEQHGKEN